MAYDKRTIMRNAWAHWRRVSANYAPWQLARGVVTFAQSLRTAWFDAKQAVLNATPEMQAIREELEYVRWSAKTHQGKGFGANAASRREDELTLRAAQLTAQFCATGAKGA